MGVLVWFLSFFVFPKAIGLEMSQSAIDRIPIFGFAIGAALGLGMVFNESLRNFAWLVFGAMITGWLLWLFLVFVIALGLSIGGLEGEAFDQAMERVSSIVFWLTVIAGGRLVAVGGCAIVYDQTGTLLERFRPKRRNKGS
jgi:hypothetical protein